MKVTVMGSGAFGFAIATMLNKNGHQVTMWCSDDVKALELQNKTAEMIPGINIPDDMIFTTSYEEAMKEAKVIYMMTAAKYIAEVCQNIKPYINKDMVFCIGSKGIEQESCKFVHQVFSENLKTKHYGVISGASFAVDLANSEPIGFSLVSNSVHAQKLIRQTLANDSIKLRNSNDMIGIELCGSIKNVIAVAAGMLEGMGYNESTRSFLIVESMHDIKELIKGLGGKKKTILSYAGIGDLLLTCTSIKSRNYSYGILLGKKDYKQAEDFLNKNTVEGYYTLKSIYTLLRRKKIKMPVIDLIYKIVMKNADPSLLVNFLIQKK